MLDQQLPECASTPGIIPGERDGASHSSDGGDGVVDARDVEQRRDLPDALSLATHQPRRRTIQRELRGRKRARAELVFQAFDADVAEGSIAIAKLDEEYAQPRAAGGRAFDSSKRHRHL